MITFFIRHPYPMHDEWEVLHVLRILQQGTLTEREGSLQLTSSIR
jgi:hypothetical protein